MKKIILLLSAVFLFSQDFIPINPFETNTTQELNATQEFNTTNEQNSTSVETITLEENITTLQPKINIAILIDKKKFFKFIPSITNSINAYFLSKDIQYHLKVYDIDTNISDIKNEGFNDILIYSLDNEFINNLTNYQNINFYIPVLNKNDINIDANNFYFGGIDYKNQISEFINYMDTDKAIAINDNTLISKKLFNIENEFNLTLTPYEFPNIYYKDLNQSYVFLNLAAGKSVQVLSNITANEIETKLVFATQIDYDPLLIEISQPQDIQKLIIANSIINVPNEIEDINLNLNSDIKYNWLNYATNVLLNKIYNKITQSDEFYMNDFGVYIFENQINYKTKLYQILNGAFSPIK